MLCSARQLKFVVLSTAITSVALQAAVSRAFAQIDEESPHQEERLVDSPPAGQFVEADEIEVQTFDFNEAIQAHARDRELPVEEARAEALRYLLATPGLREKSSVTTEELRPGVFRIRAPKWFHDAVTANMAWLRHGKKQIVIELKFLQVPSLTRAQLHADFAEAWVTSATGNLSLANPSQPKAPPTITASSDGRHPPIRFAMWENRGLESTEFVSATTQTVRATPCRVAKLTADQVDELLRMQESDRSITSMVCWKVTLFPEQNAVIQDVSQRPFVVSVKPTTENGITKMDPVIQVLDEGVKTQIRVTPRGDQVELTSSIILSEIGDVDTFTFKPKDHAQQVTVQIPHQQIRQVDLVQYLENGTSLLIDPHFFKETTLKKRFRADVTTRQYTMLLISARLIDEEPLPKTP